MINSKTVIDGRYVIQAPMNSGGMGSIYQAVDRLSGATIALKQVTNFPDAENFQAAAIIPDYSQMKVALANEFQILASLRHPHIINVLDYGFTQDGFPYFTMENLGDAQSILEAGKNQNEETKIGFIIQLLQALSYLHRNGILHRDLKPGNVLVKDAQVKLLDFGLSVAMGQAKGAAGTVQYMAPEVLLKRQPTEQSDLYSVGILAFQLLSGHHPLDVTSPERYFQAILDSDIDWGKLKCHERFIPIIRKLLKYEPKTRFQRADECIADIRACLANPEFEENPEIRESFLQAARFIGREKELETLTHALGHARVGKGEIWLVGGESGVGKSRLLEEIEIRAMISGMVVLEGQGVSEGESQPYIYWREPLRRLLLNTPISDPTAGVLIDIIPDIEALIGRRTPPIPPLEGIAGRERLLTEIADIFRVQEKPILLMLEDLQWASESLDVIEWLSRDIPDLPLLIVGTYRNDENPDLPDRIPEANQLALDRLSMLEVAELSASMLGTEGQKSEMVLMLHKQTEGNVFFLIEVVREIFKQAANSREIPLKFFPTQVFPEGIRTIVSRKLERVPETAIALLKLAAVAGRLLNLTLLEGLAASQQIAIDLNQWLSIGLNTAVLIVYQGNWRFAHDKVREGILELMSSAETSAAHEQIALELEKSFSDNRDLAIALAYHWGAAGNRKKEAEFAMEAGHHTAAKFANEDAINYFSRALELIEENNTATRFELHRYRERIYALLGRKEAQRSDLAKMEALAAEMQDQMKLAEVRLGWAIYHESLAEYPAAVTAALATIKAAKSIREDNFPTEDLIAKANLVWGNVMLNQGDYPLAKNLFESSVNIFHTSGLRQKEAQGMIGLGEGYFKQSNYSAAKLQYETARDIFIAIKDRHGEGEALRLMGKTATITGKISEANDYFIEALLLNRQLGDRRGEALCLNNLGVLANYEGSLFDARDYYQQSLKIFRDIRNIYWEANQLHNIGLIWHQLGETARARGYTTQSYEISVKLGDRLGEALSLLQLGVYDFEEGNLNQAESIYREGLKISQEIGDLDVQADAKHYIATVWHAIGDREKAAVAFEQGAHFRRSMDQPHREVEDLAWLARIAGENKDYTKANELIERILKIKKDTPNFDGAEQPFRVFFNTYLALVAVGNESRAKKIITDAHDKLRSVLKQVDSKSQWNEIIHAHPIYKDVFYAYHRT